MSCKRRNQRRRHPLPHAGKLRPIPGCQSHLSRHAGRCKGMLKSAIRDNDPVCVMENTILYNLKGEVPDDEYLVPLGKANALRRNGSFDYCAWEIRSHLLQVAQTLEETQGFRRGRRSPIRPLDTETILASVRKTNRVLLVEENNRFAAWTLKLPFLFKIRLSITLTLPSRGFPPSTLRKLTARHSKTQIPNHDRVLGKAMELI